METKAKVLGISGSPIQDGNTDVFLKECLKAAGEIKGVTTEMISLAKKDIKDCSHCNWCVTKQSEGKFCSIKDDLVDIFPKLLEADGFLIATPVYISRLSGYLANFFDRVRCLAHGCHYRGRLANKPAGALSVIWYRNSGAETALLSVIGGFLTFNMLPVGAGLGGQWGAAAMSSLHGTGKFDPKNKLGVLKDEYGLMAGRTVARRVAVIAKALKTSHSILAEIHSEEVC